MSVQEQLQNAPHEYTLIPFWFWNDELTEVELARQIDDFVAHGVYGFVIHPRIGLPCDIGFMSERYLYFVRFAVEYATQKGMVVHLYDEGMYPSGSACGKVVAENPALATRCLIHRPFTETSPTLQHSENLVTVYTAEDGTQIAFIDAPSFGKIRGVHEGQDDGEDDQPLAADLLNPDATAAFIKHVYEGYFQAVCDFFGTTVRAIFTDEPDLLGRRHRPNAIP